MLGRGRGRTRIFPAVFPGNMAVRLVSPGEKFTPLTGATAHEAESEH